MLAGRRLMLLRPRRRLGVAQPARTSGSPQRLWLQMRLLLLHGRIGSWYLPPLRPIVRGREHAATTSCCGATAPSTQQATGGKLGQGHTYVGHGCGSLLLLQ